MNDSYESDNEHVLSDNEFYVNGIEAMEEESSVEVNSIDNKWIVPLDVNKTVVAMKLDTGSAVNILPKKDYDGLEIKPKLLPAKVKLTAYHGGDIPVVGKCVCTVICKQKLYHALFIVANSEIPILGAKDCERFDLVRRLDVHEVAKGNAKYKTLKTEFKEVFDGSLGCLPDKCRIQIEETCAPVVEPCRKVPFALKDKLKEELERMEDLGVVCKVSEPTEWVNAFVIAHKKNGDIRVCLDPRNLNKAVKREHFKMPTREEMLSNFANAKVFSKMDASSGFWQMRLTEDSSYLTTFNTPFGRYRYLRVPFGICSAPEIYHRTITSHFEHIDA